MTKRPLSQTLFRMFVGMLVGLALCSVAAATGLLGWMKTLPGEDLASVGLALVLFFLAGFAVIVSVNKRTYKAIADNYREGDPVDGRTLGTMRTSAVILLMSGVLMLTPTIAVQSGASETLSMAIAGALILLVAIQTWLSLRVMRGGDELTNAANTEGCVIGFWVSQIGLYVWAALAKLGLAVQPSLWTLMILSMGVYLVISIGVSMRRGLFA